MGAACRVCVCVAAACCSAAETLTLKFSRPSFVIAVTQALIPPSSSPSLAKPTRHARSAVWRTDKRYTLAPGAISPALAEVSSNSALACKALTALTSTKGRERVLRFWTPEEVIEVIQPCGLTC